MLRQEHAEEVRPQYGQRDLNRHALHEDRRLPLLPCLNCSQKHVTAGVLMSWVQMVSLLHLANITEEGVQFASPVDGSLMMLTPEHSMAVQNRLGVPITCMCA